jgi:hypothetical protein
VPHRSLETVLVQMNRGALDMVSNSKRRLEVHEPFIREENWHATPTKIADCPSDVSGGSCGFSVTWAKGYVWACDVFHLHQIDDGELILVQWKKD